MQKHKAFTLAEILISLAVISVVSTFSIAKVTTAYQTGVKKAILKEAVSTVNQAFYMADLEGKFLPVDVVQFIGDTIGAAGKTFNPNNAGLPFYWVVLNNGTWIEIASYTNDPNGFYDVLIDVNGDTVPPNVRGEDRIHLIGVMKRSNWSPMCGQMNGKIYAPSPAICNYWGSDTTNNFALYNSLF
jgi:prepilin-type N-terminal cleavage/methylation domain-containing protein